ncbi:cytochrome d ubiquinol oxidase subunit II [Breznakibacter xylanolyticus]|uniref:Cytochrome d ubiquinol oxidase subunit II n=1 Tax=Breznakibacter xylanolyticus TaxID=990 RepID=A0A2W7NBU1_9BACT|nr:cytochrome d ubiquinol oxidase subunit II [Breznakibacter xylanolyticus]PZX17450.1 cytochrome d ubiquinol oxidase subunit II [Breznakibacter xylanolyticus]
MFETLSHLTLQQYWWFLISLLGGLLVFLMFVQGGQTLFFTLSKTRDERTMLINALGRKWEFTFTTLVTFGGAFFASFPLFYSTSFGGAYWVWMIILFAFVVQAVSYEFRSRPNNLLGGRTYEVFLFINGLIGTLFIGTAVATFFTGSPFIVTDMNHSKWQAATHGLELALNVHNLTLGLTVFFLARTLGLLYFINSIDSHELIDRCRRHLWYNAVPFVVLFLTFVTWLMLREGFAVHPTTKEVTMEAFKYFNNLLAMPVVLVVFLGGVLAVLYGIGTGLLSRKTSGIWYAGVGTVLTVVALFLIAGLNHTSFYPSTVDLQSSLTIENASSSHFTLTAMSYVSLFIPVVLGYIWITWRSINRNKIDSKEIHSDDVHVY